MKKKILAVAAAVVLLAACFFIYRIWNARKAASSAVEAYNAAAQEYNDAISPYNEAAAGIADENTKLQTALDSADAVLKKGGEAYEPDTQKKLEKAVKKARKSLTEAPVLIDPFEIRTVPAVFSTKELALLQDEAETAREMAEDAKGKIPAVPEVPDFSEEINEVGTAQKNYENSIRMLANITKPSDRFVKERLGRIKTVIQAEAVTPENDPNGLLGKKDGYIGCVYFLDESVDQSLLPKEAFSKKEKKEKKDTADEAMSADTAATVSEATSADTAGTEAEASSADTAGTEAEAASADTAGTEAEASSADTAGTEAEAASSDTAGTEAEAVSSDRAGTETEAEASSADTAAAAAEAAPAARENGADVVMIGTAGGGAVEVFASREEAEKRAEYISFFEGSVMDAGSCTVEGTCLIRTSKYLSGDQQEKLTKKIREALLAVDD